DEFFPQKLALAHPDLVFNLAEGLHGQNRESLVPAICEYFNIPYTGSDPLTLALSLHKARTKELLAYRGVPTAPLVCVERPQDLARVSLPYPVFVKPVCEGSGKGIFVNNRCETPAQLRERVLFLLERYAEPVLVETYLPGPEFTVAILGNGPQAYCFPIVGFALRRLVPRGHPRRPLRRSQRAGAQPAPRNHPRPGHELLLPQGGAGRRLHLRRAHPGRGAHRVAAPHRPAGATPGDPRVRPGGVGVKVVILYDPGAEDWTAEDVRSVTTAVSEIAVIFDAMAHDVRRLGVRHDMRWLQICRSADLVF